MSPRWLLPVLLLATCGSCLRRLDDICLHHSSRRLYLDLGETGVLTAFNVSTSSGVSRQTAASGKFFSNVTSHEQCVVEIVTCPSCVINVVFRHLDLSHHCGGGNLLIDSPCRCDYVWISEPPYEDVSGAPFCGISAPDGVGTSYKSRTRSLSIALLFSESHRHAFTLEYTSERNRQYLVGSPSGLYSSTNSTTSGVITSPFFPSLYPRDLGVEYVISCASDPPVQTQSTLMQSLGTAVPTFAARQDLSCRVRLIFSDFLVGSASVIEFFDGNNQRIEVTSGSSFRPPVIVSTGPSLAVRFYANGGSGLGFKAYYSFISGNYVDKSVKPSTDCGGFVENFGGAITMMNMVERGIKSYDCVWLIRPPKNFLHLKTHLYLKVATFSDFAGSTELQIRQGLTSELPALEALRYPISQMHQQRPKEHIIPINSGFYVSLKGSFGPASRLAITYASFSYNKCFAGSEFLCQNHRCIPGKLSCDGLDHCGDNSDEPASCYQEWEMEPVDRRWYSHTPNYYFPKMERYPDLKTATLVFVVSSLGLILLISALIVLLYRMGTRARQQRELHSRLQTISELLDGARIEEIITPDDPPDYEAPPDYDDVIKVKSSPRAGKKRRVAPQRRRSRSSPGDRRESAPPVPPMLEVVLPAEAPRRSPRTRRPAAQQPSSLTSETSLSPQLSQSNSNLPDSPPPPYSTGQNFTFAVRVASEGNIAELSAANVSRTEMAARRQTWQVFQDDSFDHSAEQASHLRHQSMGCELTESGGQAAVKKPRRRHRRSHSCNMRLQTERAAPQTLAAAAEPAPAPATAAFQLDVAIETQLHDLLTACSTAQPSSPTLSQPNTESETCYLSSLEAEIERRSKKQGPFGWETVPFDTFNEYRTGVAVEMTSNDHLEDDQYWDEFDKQFQNPNRRQNGSLQKGKKVANLSKRYDSIFTSIDERGRVPEGKEEKEKVEAVVSEEREVEKPARRVKKVLRKKARALESGEEGPGACDCAGACGCASTSNAPPVRKKKRLRKEDDRQPSGESSSCEWSSGSTVENFLDDDEI